MKVKLLVVWALAILALGAINMFKGSVDPLVSSKLAVKTVNGENTEFVAQKAYENSKDGLGALGTLLKIGVILSAGAYTVLSLKKSKTNITNGAAGLCVAFLAIGLSSCKPYNKPIYVEVKPSETVYVIPLVGDTKDQAKMDSSKYEEFKKLGVKRIQVPMEWISLGRTSGNGKYIPTIRVIKVDRSSVTRWWSKESDKGSTGGDQAVHVESKDSVNFSLGFKATAYIAEEDTSTFLYYNANRIKESGGESYQVVGLDEIMDMEILTMIQKVSSTEFGKFNMDEGRAQKTEIYGKIDTEVIPFFKKRGITIITIAQTGGMCYENPSIQKAIDQTIMDQQLKVSAEAKRESQMVENETIKLAATSKAAALMTEKEAEAKAIFLIQEQTAKGMQLVAEASKAAGSSSAYIELQKLEVAKKFAEKYQGGVPGVLVMGGKDGAGSASNLILPIPSSMMQQATPEQK